MNVIAIGDLHGRSVWKLVNTAAADRVVFLGDYVDNRRGLTDGVIYQNLVEIIELKREKPKKIVLLIGNHDAQYLHYPLYSCSGFRPAGQPALTELFVRHKNLFQVAWQQGSHLFTHAGVSTEWYRYRSPYFAEPEEDTPSLADQLNAMHTSEERSGMLFDVGPSRGGYEPYGGPVWADRSETIDNHLPGYHQVVGHTTIAEISTFGDSASSITYCDVTQTRPDFYEIDL